MKNSQIPKLIALEKFIQQHKDLVSLRQMRRYIAESEKNGASMFIHRIGRRIFIDVDKFFEWTKRKTKK